MGMMADDGTLGGLRIKGEFTGAESETSPKVMAAMGWFRGLVLELGPMPNSDLHQSINNLHKRFLEPWDRCV